MKQHLPTFCGLVSAALIVWVTQSAYASQTVGTSERTAQYGPTIDRIRQTGTIVIAHRESSIPLSYLDENHRPVGYAIDFCQHIAEAVKAKLGLSALNVKYLLVTTANRIPAIAEGRADLECGSTTNNAERREKVAFTVPHYITGARFLVRADSSFGELNDFENHSLVSTQGTTPLAAAKAANRDRLLNIRIVEAADHKAAVEMVEKGVVNGFVMDDVLLYGLRSTRASPNILKVVGKFLTVEPLAIMMSKDDPAFKQIVDDEMKLLIASKEAYKIYDRWFMRPIPPRNVSLDMPMNYLLRDFWQFPSDWVPN